MCEIFTEELKVEFLALGEEDCNGIMTGISSTLIRTTITEHSLLLPPINKSHSHS